VCVALDADLRQVHQPHVTPLLIDGIAP
jgi:hypothetical protein